MDTKTLEKFKHNFTQIYPCPTTWEQEYYFRAACEAASYRNTSHYPEFNPFSSVKWLPEPEQFVYNCQTPERRAWENWKREVLGRIEFLYSLNPLAVMKHVDEGGIGEDFYLEEV